MPVRIRCRNGHRLTTDDETVGQIVQCPTCNTSVDVPQPKPSRQQRRRQVDQDDHELREFKATVRRNLGRLRIVNVGLGLHFYKFVSLLVGVTLFMGVMVLAPAAAGSRSVASLLYLAIFIGTITGFVLPPILGIVGSGLCVKVPDDKARLLICFSLICDVAGIGVAGILLLRRLLQSSPALLIDVAGGLFLVAAWVLLMLFLRQLASVLQDKQNEDEPFVLLFYGGCVAAGLIGIGVLVAVIATLPRHGEGSTYAGALGLLAYILAIAWVVFYVRFIFRLLNLISALRKKIEARLTQE